MEKLNALGNIKIDNKKSITCSVNVEIYPIDVVQSAAYMMMDKAYIILDGDPKNEILVELRPKENQEIEKVAMQFNEELLNYAVYKNQSEKNKNITELILQRALYSSNVVPTTNVVDNSKDTKTGTEDKKGILKPWEDS